MGKGSDVTSLLVKAGIRLDLGCGEAKQPGFVGIDRRELPGVDIVHDLEEFPWPLPDDCCTIIIGSHIVEHIKPWLTVDFLNECWRVARPGCQLAFVHPYGVNSQFVQDPTHCNPCNEATWQYFDPRYPLWLIYFPKPWKLMKGFPVWQENGLMEVVYTKLAMDEAHKILTEERLYDEAEPLTKYLKEHGLVDNMKKPEEEKKGKSHGRR